MTARTPFTLQVQHDGVDTERYDLLLGGVVSQSKPVDPAGVNFQFADGLEAGTYEFTVAAVGPGGSATSDPLVLSIITGVPSVPRLILIVG